MAKTPIKGLGSAKGDFLRLIASAINKRCNMDVEIQDQDSPVIDLRASRKLSNLILTQNTVRDTYNITCDIPDAVPTPWDFTVTPQVIGDTVCLKEGDRFGQYDILAVQSNGGNNYTLTLDSPLDFAYTTAGGCSLNNTNLAVNGATTPVVFAVSPVLLNADIVWDITRTIFGFRGGEPFPQSPPDTSTFGSSSPALVKGIVLRRRNEEYYNIFNAKTNFDLSIRGFDIEFDQESRIGEYGVRYRRTFNGQDKNGVVQRLFNDEDPEKADSFEIIVQDDLSAHTQIVCVIQGHIVQD